MAGMGPRPAADPVARLSSPRAAVLAFLVERGDTVTVAEVCDSSGQHANTVREHLEALVAAGLVEREQLPPQGRGRPAIGYRALTEATVRPTRVYATFLEALAEHLAESSDEACGTAMEVGRRMGRGFGPDWLTAMDELGFEHTRQGEADGDIRFVTCPVVAAARRATDVVCTMHAGMMREMSGREVEVEPFVVGGCRVHGLA